MIWRVVFIQVVNFQSIKIYIQTQWMYILIESFSTIHYVI